MMAKRVSSGFDKKIFGVPVFPVMKASSNGNYSHDHSNDLDKSFNNLNNPHVNNNSQAYNIQHRISNLADKTTTQDFQNNANNNYKNHFQSNNNYINTTVIPINNNTMTNLTNQWKLRHIDFMPSSIKTKKDEEFEKFSELVEKANDWSINNSNVIIFSCESVTWTSVDKPIYTDTGILMRSMASDRRTKFCRGLRLWYFIFEEVFIKRSSSFSIKGGGGAEGNGERKELKLCHFNYTCDAKGEASFSLLLKKFNADVARKAIQGKILKVETLELLNDVSDADTCVWFEQPDKAKDYTWFVRVLLAIDSEEAFSGEIEVLDFIPMLDQKNPHNAGYETYEDLWRKASSYIYHNPQINFVCVQSLFVKIKKDTETKLMTLWDKCTHCQHASSYGALSNHRTEFLQILRLTYYKSNTVSLARNTPPVGSTGKKLFYKYFSPSPMKRAILSPASSPSDDQDSTPVDGLYEDLKTLEDKINAWLFFSGAKVAGVETLATRLGSGGQEMLASEATSVYNQRERNLNKEPWKITIRLVLEGEFKERPIGWEDKPKEAQVGSGGIRSDF